jgi:hypothetical protein
MDNRVGLSVTAWLGSDFVEHVLTSQRLGDTFGLVLGQRVIGIGARNLEDAVVNHYHSKRAEGDARTDDDLVHVVQAKMAGLFNPIFDEWIAQSVFGFRLGEIRAFDDETIFAHFFGRLSRFVFWSKSRRQVSGRANFTTKEK